METTLQKISSHSDSSFEKAKKYYGILFIANGLEYTQRDLELAAFIGVHGNIFFIEKKKEFCELVNTSMATLANIISKLYKMGVIVKQDGVIDLQPAIKLNFDNVIVVEISLKDGR